MQKRLIGILVLALIVTGTGCRRSEESPRKIRLSDEVRVQGSEQGTTTLHLAGRERQSIAVMFFDNLTGDSNLEWLKRGLAEMFIRSLSQSSGLNVISTDRLVEIIERLGKEPDNVEMDMTMTAMLAREANVEIILTGNINKRDGKVRIEVRVHEAEGSILHKSSTEGQNLENIFSMVDDLAQRLRGDILLTAEKTESKGIASLTTNSLQAWKHYTSGVDFFERYMISESLRELETAVKLDPTFIAAHLKLGEYLRQARRYDDSEKVFQAIFTYRDQATPKERYQMDLLGASIRNDAITYIDLMNKWLEQYPEDVDAHQTLANLYYDWNHMEKATRHYEMLLSFDPNHAVTHNRLGYLYAKLGKWGKAEAYIKNYLDLAEDDANPNDSMGEIYLFKADFGRAERYFRKALNLNPDFLHSLRHMGELYTYQGKYKKAIEFYEKAVEQAVIPDQIADTHVHLGSLYERLHKREEAEYHYKEALEAFPGLGMALDMLIELYQEDGKNEAAHEALDENFNILLQKVYSGDQPELNTRVLATVSLQFNHRLEEVIRILETGITQVEAVPEANRDRITEINLKSTLMLFYIKTGAAEKISELWPGDTLLPDEYWTIMKDLRDFRYGGEWSMYHIVNDGLIQFPEAAGVFYDQMIDRAGQEKITIIEMMFRSLKAELLAREGKKKQCLKELYTVGAPYEDNWMIAGPFENHDGFRKKFQPEKNNNIHAVFKENGGEIRWKPANDGHIDTHIDLRRIFEDDQYSVAYARVNVYSPRNRKACIRAGFDDESRLWLNGREIWKYNENGPAQFDDYFIECKLRKGINKLMVKVCNGIGDWGFFLRITDEEGRGIPGMYYLSPAAAEDENEI